MDKVKCTGCGRTVIKDMSFKCRHCKTVTYFSANFTAEFLTTMLEGLIYPDKVLIQKNY